MVFLNYGQLSAFYRNIKNVFEVYKDLLPIGSKLVLNADNFLRSATSNGLVNMNNTLLFGGNHHLAQSPNAQGSNPLQLRRNLPSTNNNNNASNNNIGQQQNNNNQHQNLAPSPSSSSATSFQFRWWQQQSPDTVDAAAATASGSSVHHHHPHDDDRRNHHHQQRNGNNNNNNHNNNEIHGIPTIADILNGNDSETKRQIEEERRAAVSNAQKQRQKRQETEMISKQISEKIGQYKFLISPTSRLIAERFSYSPNLPVIVSNATNGLFARTEFSEDFVPSGNMSSIAPPSHFASTSMAVVDHHQEQQQQQQSVARGQRQNQNQNQNQNENQGRQNQQEQEHQHHHDEDDEEGDLGDTDSAGMDNNNNRHEQQQQQQQRQESSFGNQSSTAARIFASILEPDQRSATTNTNRRDEEEDIHQMEDE